MKRQVVGDVWIDLSKATRYEALLAEKEGSTNADIPREHSELFRSKRGTWVLHTWTDPVPARHRWVSVSEAEAVLWLLRAEHSIPPFLDAAAIELER